MSIIAGDIGGTKTLLQLADFKGGKIGDVIYEHRYVSADYANLAPMVQEFMQTCGDKLDMSQLTGACFGIAGPVAGKKAWVTNLSWEMDADDMARTLGIPVVRLINDFAAVGYGIEALGENDMVTLQEGTAINGAPGVLIGAGTGLGQGILAWAGDHYEVLASEGGHADFAPNNDLEMDLLAHLMKRFEGHVSYERVCCGRGLVNIYEFMRDTGVGNESDALKAAMESGDPAAAVSIAACEGTDPLAEKAMETFINIYGAQAGNLALTCLAYGGAYVAGGIAPKIIDKLTDGKFIESFNAKGRMSKLMVNMPVKVVTNARVGLLGAALAATRL